MNTPTIWLIYTAIGMVLFFVILYFFTRYVFSIDAFQKQQAQIIKILTLIAEKQGVSKEEIDIITNS